MLGKLPPNLTAETLALSPDELKTFPRWYTDLLIRKKTDNVTVGDVFRFLDNFGISDQDKQSITQIFNDTLVYVDPVQFYIFLRLIGHVLQGKRLMIELAFVAAPIPQPRSILATKKSKANHSADIDSFMSLMTGNGVTKRRKKRVTFDSAPPQVSEAAHRSMEELLQQIDSQKGLSDLPIAHLQPQANMPPPPTKNLGQPKSDPEPDQPINSHLANVNIDTVLHNGQSIVPKPPAPRRGNSNAGDSFINQLSAKPQAQQPPQVSVQPPVNKPLQSIYNGNSPMNLSPQVSGVAPGSQPQSQSGLQRFATQGPKLSPQVSGSIQPQSTGMFLSPQPSGLQQNAPEPPKLGPQSTGSLPITLQRQAAPPPPPNRSASTSNINLPSRPPMPQMQSSTQSTMPQIQSQAQLPIQQRMQSQPSMPQQQSMPPQTMPHQYTNSGMQPMQMQMSGPPQPQAQLPTQQMMPQSTGMYPQMNSLQPMATGISNSVPQPQQQFGYQQPPQQMPMAMQPQPTQQIQMQPQMQTQIQPQMQQMQPQMQPQMGTYTNVMQPNQPQGSQQPLSQQQTGMQFINLVQNGQSFQPSNQAPNQSQSAPNQGAYNMQQLRNQLPNY